MGRKKPAEPGRFAYQGLERVIHEKARLGILSSLATHESGVSFGDLKEMCSLTDGNLSRHLQVLEEDGLVVLRKGHSGNRPQTLCRMTSAGRRRFLQYVSVLERVVGDALGARDNVKSPRKGAADGWFPA